MGLQKAFEFVRSAVSLPLQISPVTSYDDEVVEFCWRPRINREGNFAMRKGKKLFHFKAQAVAFL